MVFRAILQLLPLTINKGNNCEKVFPKHIVQYFVMYLVGYSFKESTKILPG